MSRSSGQDMVDAFTAPSDPVPECWLAPWTVAFEDSCRMIRDLKAADRKGRLGLSPRLRKCSERSQRSGTPKATLPSGMGADDEERRGPDLLVRTLNFPSPETCRSHEPIEEGSEGLPAMPVSFGTNMTDVSPEPASQELPLREQAQEVLSKIYAVLESSPSIALDRDDSYPFGYVQIRLSGYS
eukprot:6189289-Pleurochrysis_carterae.AAC.5